MKRALKKIPQFTSEDQERAFWTTHDSTEYVDWSKARPGFWSLERSLKSSVKLTDEELQKAQEAFGKR